MSIDNKCSPDDIKLAQVSPVFKKMDDLDEENYKPVSVLSHVFLKVLKRREDLKETQTLKTY